MKQAPIRDAVSTLRFFREGDYLCVVNNEVRQSGSYKVGALQYIILIDGYLRDVVSVADEAEDRSYLGT